MRILMPSHTLEEWRSRAEKPAHSRGCTGHDEREEPTEMVLGRSGEHGRIPDE